MLASRELELAALAKVAGRSQLSLKELASAPAYHDLTSNPDCVYDGTLIELSYRAPLIADGGELVVCILGPLWDRVFQLEFLGVTALELLGFGRSIDMDLREIQLDFAAHAPRCKFLGLSFSTSIAVTYSSSTVTRLSLERPIARSQLGT